MSLCSAGYQEVEGYCALKRSAVIKQVYTRTQLIVKLDWYLITHESSRSPPENAITKRHAMQYTPHPSLPSLHCTLHLKLIAMIHSLHMRTTDTRRPNALAILLSVDIVPSSDGVETCAAKARVADRLCVSDRELALVVVDCLDDSTEGTAFEGGGDDVLALDAEEVVAVLNPRDGGEHQNNDEADHGDEVGDFGGGGVGDGALDWREDSSARDSHNQDTGSATSVLAKVGSSEGEDSWVHRRHEEEDGDKNTNTSIASTVGDVRSQSDSAASVHCQDEVGLEDGGQSGSHESTNGEDDQRI